jgi:hypothetical protein
MEQDPVDPRALVFDLPRDVPGLARAIQGLVAGASMTGGSRTLCFSPFRRQDRPVPPPMETTLCRFREIMSKLPADNRLAPADEVAEFLPAVKG